MILGFAKLILLIAIYLCLDIVFLIVKNLNPKFLTKFPKPNRLVLLLVENSYTKRTQNPTSIYSSHRSELTRLNTTHTNTFTQAHQSQPKVNKQNILLTIFLLFQSLSSTLL